MSPLAGPDGRDRLPSLLRLWAERGWLRPLDVAFAEFLIAEIPDAHPLAIFAAALASHQLGRGHACLDLQATLDDPTFALSLPPDYADWADPEPTPRPAELLEGLALADWQAALVHPLLVGDGPGASPLVLVGPRLYLRRYWDYERAVRRGVRARIQGALGLGSQLPLGSVRRILDRLFPDAPPSAPDWQKIACALVARGAFGIVTGGPGTGKTTTVVRMLALLQALALEAKEAGREPRPLRIRLAAPTGKAAARLNESIAGAVAGLPLAGLVDADRIRASIPVKVATLHRLLGSRPDTRKLRHHAGNPLALDVLVIDEASMIDLELMASVLDALPPGARLVLLGDRDQLASVEAGAVLAELCRGAREGHYSPETRDWIAAATGETIGPELIDPAGSPLDQYVVMLRHSRRFAADSGIARLAEAVNAGNAERAIGIWRDGGEDLGLVQLAGPDDPAFGRLVVDGRAAANTPSPLAGEGLGEGTDSAVWADAGGPTSPTHLARPYVGTNSSAQPASSDEDSRHQGYRHYLELLRTTQPAPDANQDAFHDWAREVLKAHRDFQVLTALRSGPWGVDGLNRRIARLLESAGLIPASAGWYLGRPVLVTRNDYALGLANGDIGIALATPGGAVGGSSLRVAFNAGDGLDSIKWVLPSRLQQVETVYALTVHKSQGSEFGHVALVLPDRNSPILTRELLYTAITRARDRLTLCMPGSDHVLAQAIERRVSRTSGLGADKE